MAKKSKSLGLKVQSYLESLKNFRFTKKVAVAALIIGLLLLLIYKKNWIIAATVNGQPIATFELNQKMNKLYKDKILNQLINEKILQQEAFKNGVIISAQQIQEKVAEAEKSYGGKEVLEMLLSQQGLTRDEFISQTRLQLMVEKLYEKEASPTAEEIQKFMTDNQNLPEATEEAKFKKLAEDSIRQEKLSKIFSEKFKELRQQAKIQIF